MKQMISGFVFAGLFLAAQSASAITINLTSGVLRDQNGVEIPDGSTLMVIVSTSNATFGALTSPNQASASSFANEPDDLVLARWGLDSSTAGVPGADVRPISLDLGNLGITANDPIILVWYSGLLESSSPAAPGSARRFGTFRDSSWTVPGDNGATIDLNFLTEFAGGSLPNSEGITDQITEGQAANQPPIALCTNVLVVANASCQGLVTSMDVDNGSSDPDGSIAERILTPAGPYPVGTTLVSLTVIDNLGASNSCSASVTVVDATPPVASCRNLTLPLDATGNANLIAAQIDNGSTDGCGIQSRSVSPNAFTCANLGSNQVTLTVTDLSGNSSTCTGVVTVVDVTPLLSPVGTRRWRSQIISPASRRQMSISLGRTTAPQLIRFPSRRTRSTVPMSGRTR